LRNIKTQLLNIFIDIYYFIKFDTKIRNSLIYEENIINDLKKLTDNNTCYKLYKFIYWDCSDIFKFLEDEDDPYFKNAIINFIDSNIYYDFNHYKRILYEKDYYDHHKNDYKYAYSLDQYDYAINL